MVLIDSDVMVDVLRGYPPAIAWLESLGEEEIILPGFVVMELLQGCGDKAEQREVERRLASCKIAWPPSEACDEALSTFCQYHLSHNLGLLDALIGQLAVTLRLPLHTFNQKHYAVIDGLDTVQPYEKNV